MGAYRAWSDDERHDDGKREGRRRERGDEKQRGDTQKESNEETCGGKEKGTDRREESRERTTGHDTLIFCTALLTSHASSSTQEQSNGKRIEGETGEDCQIRN